GTEEKTKAGECVLTDALDHNNGFVSISFNVNKESGNLEGKASLKSVKLTPAQDASDFSWLQAKFQENIQRAHGIVFTEFQGAEYAIVADYNMFFNDPHFLNDTSLTPKQIGGKIGIIKDPFGRDGGPEFIGATTPIVGGSVDKLDLSPDGKTLMANVFTEEGIFSTMSMSLLVWDVKSLIQAALTNKETKGLTNPIDLNNPGARATRFRGPSADDLFPWIYGMAQLTTSGVTLVSPIRQGSVPAEAPANPVFKFRFDNVAVKEYSIFVSTFPDGKGLFPSDTSQAAKDSKDPVLAYPLFDGGPLDGNRNRIFYQRFVGHV